MESTRVVSSDNSGRCSMENDDDAPKFKRRRVSAVRDFPPGCGPLAVPIVKQNEKAVCVGTVENSVTKEKSIGGCLEKINRVETKGKEPIVSSDQVNGLEFAMISLPDAVDALNGTSGVESVGAAGVFEAVKAVEHKIADASENLCKVDVTGPVENVVQQKYPNRRRISAVRDFPPFCGPNAPLLNKEEAAKVLVAVDKKSLNQEKSVTEEKPMEEIGGDVKDGDSNESRLESASRMDGVKVQVEPDTSVHRMKVGEENRHESGIKSPQETIRNQHDQKSTSVSKSGEIEIGDLEENLGRDLVAYVEDKSYKRKLSDRSTGKNSMFEGKFEVLQPVSDRKVVQGLMAEQNCPWRKGQTVHKPNMLAGDSRESKGQKHNFILHKRSKSALKTKINDLDDHVGIVKKNSSPTVKAKEVMDQMTECNKEDYLENDNVCDDFRLVARSHNFGVSLPPSCPSSLSGKGDGNDAIVTRNKVRETLRLFQAVCRKLLQEEEAKPERATHRRIDLQASKILKEKGKCVNVGKQIFGSVPGVEVGDDFMYRVELNIVGLHRQIQGGIDYVKQDGKILATSIVSSGGYDDDTDNSDVLIYTGSGGNMMNGDKEPEDQKLERGNLALKNSMDAKNPVRVIRGDSKSTDSVDARGRTYIYDGLYLVEKCWQEIGSHGKLVFKFKLVRILGQPELAGKVVRKSKKFKVREGVCVDDISQGREKIPICAVNTIDDEKPPPFKYTTHMIYPHWCRRLPPKGCDCINGCSESRKCPCLEKNGGIPYNHNGAIVEAKPLVYECGPSCKCPPSCYNRVSQHGIKFQLEIFKTGSRGWGVRSLNSIPSGSFICEYAGELLEEKEAEQRTGNDEYLFDIGNQFNDNFLWDGLTTLMPEAQSGADVEVQNSGFTIDAAQCGNVGRFINHSCSPNLYAQTVIYDHDDKRIPHIMFFAAENIPPLQELAYHYNYMIDQVFDSNGNIKKKNCYCGSPECTGRMY
ncbi:unnamed protein product [Dovyalis caffra]|uniref:Uncharacterized protein n=1 Tax=Dovyalis caffra TaxID=77055 RepID=A0AAV1SRX0_9ROSI|nr:unnamed protein product [Dovyalis caffra]